MLVGSQVAKQTVQRLYSEASRKRRAGQRRFGEAGEETDDPKTNHKMKNDEFKVRCIQTKTTPRPGREEEKFGPEWE